MSGKRNRRNLLHQLGAAVALSGFAGCIGGNPLTDLSDDQDVTDQTAGGNPQSEESLSMTTSSTSENAREGDTLTDNNPVTEPAPKRVDQILDGAKFYDGNMVVGLSTVAVGAGETNIGFDPAAIKVAAGTEVTWEWAGGVAKHSVTSIETKDQQSFNSGRPRAGSSVTYRHTFTKPGIYQYICGIHRIKGAIGVVVVVPGSDVGGQGSG